MKQSRFTESQIIKALKENEQGRKAEDICRELGIHKGTFYPEVSGQKKIFRYGLQSVEGIERAQGREPAVEADVC